jgi:hypothetical protein
MAAWLGVGRLVGAGEPLAEPYQCLLGGSAHAHGIGCLASCRGYRLAGGGSAVLRPVSAASPGPVRAPLAAVPAGGGEATARRVVAVPVLSLRPGESPRQGGEDKAHIARLAEIETPFPPILVDRRTMRVIDGMHRLLAASLRGQQTIDAVFFEGSPADAFLHAVKANVAHGFPLSLPDRRTAAARIIASHPQLSDRAIADAAGLAATTVAAIRRRCAGPAQQVSGRVGRDGRIRPLNSAEGRLRAAALLAEHPAASTREVARAAGISPATAWDVRTRLRQGREPTVPGPGGASGPPRRDQGTRPPAQQPPAQQPPAMPETMLEKLSRDPSLRHNDHGRRLLRLMQLSTAGARERPGMTAAVPPHRVAAIGQLARGYAQFWLGVAHDLEERDRVINPRNHPRTKHKT